MEEFTPESLVSAIRNLFTLNYYDVEGPIRVNGAEVDLVARRRNDPFGSSVYVEATTEYVDTEKYGKDTTKFLLIREQNPSAQLLIVSSRGFSLPVKERAEASRIKALTYSELFAQFERFEAYVRVVTGGAGLGLELQKLEEIYEEPRFEDKLGNDLATSYLTAWRDESAKRPGWLVIVGEYGTGKTALTKVLQYRWMLDYKMNPALPIPLRIELREFSRQFDARGLLHHFLDHNELAHISVDFVYSLINHGRVILILDGYDEMAQYLNARERRVCLEALAELSAGGARGLLTSRPNYFTENEELQVFEALYASFKHDHIYLGREARALLEREAWTDKLLEQFLYRYERSLRDLTNEQTEALVERILSHDPPGQRAVLGILRSVFRGVGSTDSKSLSGKPVIISYLLEIVEDLKGSAGANVERSSGTLTEWQVYRLIVDHLMARDLRRSPEIYPDDRRRFLHKLGVFLSQPGNHLINEEEFRGLIRKEFARELRRYDSDMRAQQVERYFADLRGSATLTRSEEPGQPGWRFSHNSLREYLVAEYLLKLLEGGSIFHDKVPVSDAMRTFAASRHVDDLRHLLELLANSWGERGSHPGLGQLLMLLWEGALSLFQDCDDTVRELLRSVCGNSLALNGISVSRMHFSTTERPTDLGRANFSSTDLESVDFSGANLSHADFSDSTLDSINFSGAELGGARFVGCIIENAIFVAANVSGASFRGIKPHEISVLIEGEGEKSLRRLVGLDALGFLQYCGGVTDAVPISVVLRHHPNFSIVEKIIQKLAEQSIRQRRGVEQRGEARRDVRFARRFVEFLESRQLIRIQKHRKELIEVTDTGREVFNKFTAAGEIPEVIVAFLRDE